MLLVPGGFVDQSPLSQIRWSTFPPLQQTPDTRSFGGLGLRYRRRQDLSQLLARATVEFLTTDFGFPVSTDVTVAITRAVIEAPISDYERLTTLSKEDNEQIHLAIQEVWPYEEQEGDMVVTEVGYRLDLDSLEDGSDDSDDILQQLDHVKSTMVSVSTGGPRINDVNAEFKKGCARLTEQLSARGLLNPIPYSDLWSWYGKWSSGELPTYQSRREYINDLCAPLEKQLREGLGSQGTEVFSDPAGWPRVDRTLAEVRIRLGSASSEEQFQAIGLLCREVLTSLAQTVFDPTKHPSLDGVDVSGTDAKRMLDRYLAEELGGGSNTVARRCARATLALANELQHKRTADFRNAALCAETTASIVNVIAVISGMRDPQE